MNSRIHRRRCERLENINSGCLSSNSPSSSEPMKYLDCTPKPFIRHQAPPAGKSAANVVYSSRTSTLSRSKTRLHMLLNDELLHKDLEQPDRLPVIDPALREMGDRLKQQVADLSLFLEEERLIHRETKLKAEQLLKDNVDQINREQKEAVRLQALEHQTVIDNMRRAHSMEKADLKVENNQAVAKLKTEVEFIAGALRTYRAQTELEQRHRCEEKIGEATQALQKEFSEKIEEERMLLRHEFDSEADRERARHRCELELLKQMGQRETILLNRRYRDHERDLVMLSQVNNQVKELKEKLVGAEETIDALREEVNKLTNSNSEHKFRINAYERKFDERVAQASMNLQARVDELREDNSSLRMKYLKKCEELFDTLAESSTDNQQRQDLQNQLFQKIFELRKAIGKSNHNSKHSRRLCRPSERL